MLIPPLHLSTYGFTDLEIEQVVEVALAVDAGAALAQQQLVAEVEAVGVAVGEVVLAEGALEGVAGVVEAVDAGGVGLAELVQEALAHADVGVGVDGHVEGVRVRVDGRVVVDEDLAHGTYNQ